MATITIAELATTLDTDPRTARKFLRNITPKDAQPGKGSRWAIEKREVRSLKAKFMKFTADETASKAARDAAKANSDNEVIEDDSPEALDTDGPTDADLADISDDED